jgi:CBS domain-containing protein
VAERKVSEVMTSDPFAVGPDTTVAAAARMMRDGDVGALLVVEGERLAGIVTDRDIVVRVVAEGRDPAQTPVREAVSAEELVTVSPDTSVSDAVRVMREKAVRRIPVVEGDRPVGVLSIGDLAMEKDPGSALADISAAPGND